MHSVICSGRGSLKCFVIIKCTKFDQLILRKIIKIVATSCQILRLKCTEIDFGWGFRPRPRWESLQRSPRPPAGFKHVELDLRGLLLRGGCAGEGKGERGKGRKGWRKGGKEGAQKKEKGGRGKGEGGEQRSPCSDFTIWPPYTVLCYGFSLYGFK